MPEADDRSDDRRRLRHDLAGAFNELRLCAEVIQIERDPERLVEWLELIERAAGRCESLVGDLGSLPP